MPLYSAFGLKISSEIPLPELPAATGEPDVLIRHAIGMMPEAPARSDHEVIRTKRRGTFHIVGGKEIYLDVPEDSQPEFLRLILFGRVMGVLMRQRGWAPLHASVVAIDGCGVLFVGPSGSGKSTTAAALLARGHTILSDDMGPVRVLNGRAEVQPTWPRLRLLEESRTLVAGLGLETTFQIDKHTYRPGGEIPAGAAPIRRIYILEWGTSFAEEPLAASPATAVLNRQSFASRVQTSAENAALHLRICAEVSSSVPVYRLIRPQGLEAIPESVRIIESGSR